MSSFDSSGFPSPSTSPSPQPDEGHENGASEPLVPLAQVRPFEEVQPLQPLDAQPVESYAVKPPEPAQVQPVEPIQPLEPLQSLEPLQPTMPPPLPLLTAAEPAGVAPAPSVPAPAPAPEEVANLGVPLGTLIFRAGLLTEEQLEDALQEGVRSGKRLGEVLLEGGLIDERDLGRLLADQKGLRFVELADVAIDHTATALLAAEKAHMYAALPIGFDGSAPLVAVADPSNELVTENLRRALGSEPRLVVASRSDLHATIDRHHGTPVQGPVAAQEPAVAIVPSGKVAESAPPAAPVEVPPPAQPVAVEPVLAPPEPMRQPVVPSGPETVVEPTPEAAFEPAPEPVLEPTPEPAFEPAPAPVHEAAPEPVQSHEPAPEPALRPVEVAHVAIPQPEPSDYTNVAPLVPQAPAPAASPVAPEPVGEPETAAEPEAMAVVPEPAHVVPEPVVELAPEPTFSRIEEERAHEPTPQFDSAQELPSAVSYDVSLRLSDGERVQVGSFNDPQKAREYAREVVQHLSDETDGWPFFSGRFMRPETILSVDIVPVGEPDRWLGSSVRSNWASRLNR